MWVVIIVINVMAFIVMGIDKKRSVEGGRRMPERNLIMLAALLGAPGIYLAMLIYRHKTHKPSFRFGVPLLILWNIWVFWSLSKLGPV